MTAVVPFLILGCAAQADPADQLRRQELSLRLEALASEGKLEALSRATLRELRGRSVDAARLDLCWKVVGLRRWEGRVEEFVAAWDRAAAEEPAAPAPLLFRARLETLTLKPARYRELLEAALKRFPDEPGLLWFSGRARFDAGQHRAAAAALEALASHQGFPYDPDDFHQMLARSYGETDRPAAALEHLRAMREEKFEPSDLAVLARKCHLPWEAIRLYRLALSAEPDRLAHRIALVSLLRAEGDAAGAAAERRALFLAGGQILTGRVEDYIFLLPAAGRAEEVTQTLRELFAGRGDCPEFQKQLVALAAIVPFEDRAPLGAAWEKSAGDGRSWILLARMKGAWGAKPEQILEILEKGEKLHPSDPGFSLEKIDLLVRAGRLADVAAAYARLAELDPDAKRSGARPLVPVQEAIRRLVEQKDPAGALRLGVLGLSDLATDEVSRNQLRAAMKPAFETAGPEFWEEMRKLRLPLAGTDAERAIRGHLSRLTDDEFEVRSAAARELRRIGLPAIPALLERIDEKDVDLRSQAREIIRAILSE